MGKLWIVNVSLSIDVAVVADDESEAERIARAEWRDEPETDDVDVSAAECTVLPPEFAGSIPYGGEGDAPCESYLTSEAE